MPERRVILKALFQRIYWDRYGDLLGVIFQDPAVPITQRKVFAVLEDHWVSEESTDSVSLDLIKGYLGQVSDNEAQMDDLLVEISKINELVLNDSSLDKLFEKAINRHTVSKILLEAQTDLVQSGKTELSKVISELEAVERGLLSGNSLELFNPDMVDSVITKEQDCLKFPTGFVTLDGMLNGGLWESELGVLLGEVHVGKTWALTYLGVQALKSNVPVIHMTGEISFRRSHVRYYQSLLGKNRMDVMFNPADVKKELAALKLPPWCVVDFSNRAYTTSQLRQDVLKFCDTIDTQPLIIVDYIDKVKPSNFRLQERFAVAETTEMLRRIACEVNGGLWTASQVNRAAYGEQYVRKENVAEAISKVEIADVILALNQTSDEKDMGQMRWTVEKARERTIGATREVALRGMPEVQSFSEDATASVEAYSKWEKSGG
jgi:replicative DNA helicase